MARAVAVLKTVARLMVRAVAKTMATIAMAWGEIQQSTKKGTTETAMVCKGNGNPLPLPPPPLPPPLPLPTVATMTTTRTATATATTTTTATMRVVVVARVVAVAKVVAVVVASVGQNKIRHDKPTMDKRVGRTKCPRRG